jgi:hypothetical protein
VQEAVEAHRVVTRQGSHIFLDSRAADGGEVVSFTHRPGAIYPEEYPWHSFLLEAESTPGPYCGWND